MICIYCANLRKCIEKANKDGYEHNDNFDADDGCPNFGFKRNTNADRIRAMSDGELAEFISNCGCPDHGLDCTDSCAVCVMKWLKQPAEVEDGND